MNSFLQRISSRKFLISLAVQIAAVAAIFWPDKQSALNSASVQIAALAAMVLAAFGYGRVNNDSSKQRSTGDVNIDSTVGQGDAPDPDVSDEISEDDDAVQQ